MGHDLPQKYVSSKLRHECAIAQIDLSESLYLLKCFKLWPISAILHTDSSVSESLKYSKLRYLLAALINVMSPKPQSLI